MIGLLPRDPLINGRRAPLLAAERIMRRLAEEIGPGSTMGGHALPTIAWGMAPAPPEEISVDTLVDAADRAM